MPDGQPGDDEHAEPQVVGERDDVELRGLGELRVERRVLLLGHAEPAVLDLDRQPLGHRRGPHPDRARRGRVRRRVVDQLREQVDHVGHRGRRQVQLLVGVHLHPLVLGDLADGAAQDVDQGDRLGPAAAGLLAADDHEVLLVAAQLTRGGVQRVQPGEHLGVLVLALQRVELAELEVDQVLALPRDAQDDLLEAAPGVGELHRGVHGRALRGVERLCHLAEFVAPVVQRRGGRVDVHLLAPVEPGHHLGQPLLRQAQGGLAQPAQPPGERAGDAPGQDDADQQREQPAGAQPGRLQQQRVGVVRAAVEQLAGLLPDQLRVLRGEPVEGVVPPLVAVRQPDVTVLRPAGDPGLEHLVLDVPQRRPVRALHDLLGTGLGRPAQRRHDLVLHHPPLRADELGELRPRGVVQLPGRPGEGQLRVLLRDQLRRVLQGDQRSGLRGEVAVVDLGQFLEGVDLVVDDRGVLVQRLGRGDVGEVVHLAAVVLQALRRGDHGVHPIRDPRGGAANRLRTPHQLGDGRVRLTALGVQGGAGAVRGGQPRGGEPAFALERERGVGAHRAGRPAELRLVPQPQPLGEHLRRRHAPDRGERDAGHQGQQDQRETYGAEPASGGCPWRHRRPRGSSGAGTEGGCGTGRGNRDGSAGGGTGARGWSRASRTRRGAPMLSVPVLARTVSPRPGRPGGGPAAQRVPPAAYLATSAAFSLVTKAGPVSTGAAPPPLRLPLVRYNHSPSTAR